MSRQKALWFAGLSLVVGSLATATAASAQVRARSDVRRRRTGKQQPAQVRTDTVTVTRSDTVRIRDTVFVDRPLPAPPPRVDTVRLAPPPPPARLGYFGVVGGVGLPLSKTKNGGLGSGSGSLSSGGTPGYNVGPAVFGFIGANARSGVLGLRLDGGYTLLRGKNIGNGYSAHNGIDQATPDLAIYQGTLDGVIRAPFGRDSTGADHGGLYIFGGGGVAHVRSFLQDNSNNGGNVNIEQNLTRAVVQGGAGLELGALGAGKIFAEGRFVYIFTPGTKITYVPVGLGVRF